MRALTPRLVALTVLVAVAAAAAGADEEPARAAPPTARPDSVREIGLPDLAGRVHGLADLRDAEAIVLAWTAPGCPVAMLYAPRLKEVAREYGPRGVAVLGVVSDAGTDVADVRAFVEAAGTEHPVLLDLEGRLAQRVGARTTTTVVVLDAHRRIRYRGALDDQYGVDGRKVAPTRTWLRDALEAVLGARAVETEETSAPGCPITFPAPREPEGSVAADAVTWADGAGAIVHRRCATCHRPGEAGPFSLLSHEDVRPRIAVLAEVLRDGRMPPWGAEAPHGTFSNDRRLAPDEREALKVWLDAGAPEGDPARAPAPPAAAEGWEIGTPDAVFEFSRAEPVPAEGVVPYRFIEVPTDLGEDRWVASVEIQPGAPAVVHHVLVAVQAADGRKRRSLFDPTRGFFAAMVPGGRAQVYPTGTAKRLPKGAVLVFQMHYTPNGVATSDRTRIGFRFAPAAPEREVFTAGAWNPRLRIPPGARSHVETAVLPVPYDVRVLAFMPHAHVRARSFRYEVYRLGEAPRTILDVPRYDFNWQTPYRLAEPLLVSRGHWLKVTATYDNSAENPWNPDPTVEVRWGDQTWEEMLIGYVDYVRAD